MAHWIFYARTVVEEDAAQQSSDALEKQFNRFDEAYDALKWLLARNCDSIECKSANVGDIEYHLHRRAGDVLAKTPDITVLFTYDDDEVVIIDVTAEIVENGGEN